MKDFIWNILNAFICWVKDNKEWLKEGAAIIIIFAMIPVLYAIGTVFLESFM